MVKRNSLTERFSMEKLLIKKLLRDMRKSGVTFLICILIVAVGFCGYSVMAISIENLQGSRDDFMARTAFPDVFAEVQRAPLNTAQRLEAITGVLRAEGRLAKTVRLADGGENPPQLRLVSVTEGGLAVPLLSRGQMPDSSQRQIVLGDGFFAAHGLVLGGEIPLNIQGRKEVLSISGSGISPENIYMVKTMADMLPDPYNYDAGFIGYNAMAALFAEEGFANEFVLTLSPGYSFNQVEGEIKDVLQPYGCYNVYERADQLSVAMLQAELDQLGNMTTVIPFLFLGVAAVILYITLFRMVEQQRVQAGTLMALGFSRREVLLHYLGFGTLTGLGGGLLGGVLGLLAAQPMTEYYRVFFSLPPYTAPVSPRYFITGALVAALFCGLVGWGTARRLSSLMPAQALRPATPKAARASVLERIPGFNQLFTVPGMMAVRGMARNRGRSLLAIGGIACAFMITATLVSMNSLFDVFLFDYLEDTQKQDISVYFSEPVAAGEAMSAIRHQAVERAEGIVEFAATLRGSAGETDAVVQAIAEDSQLCLLYDEQGNAVFVPPQGIVLSVLMAKNLGVAVGDSVEIKTAYPQERVERVQVMGIVSQYMGNTAYMSYAGAARVSDFGGVFTAVLLQAPAETRLALLDKLEGAAKVSLVESRLQKLDKLRSSMGNMLAVMGMMALLGVLIGMAVIYTSSLISFEELKREISTLMMLGLSSRQCLDVISVGQWLLTLIAIIPGILLTMGASRLISNTMASELYAIPDFVDGGSLAMAVALTMIAVFFSSQVLLRKIKKILPVELLRERE